MRCGHFTVTLGCLLLLGSKVWAEELESEEDPFVSCQSQDNPFVCLSIDNKCIPWHRKCDQITDCPDGSDESGCSNGFGLQDMRELCKDDHHFECADGTECISKYWRCDGDFDCKDNSDELGCNPFGKPSSHTCRGDLFQCDDGLCIPKMWECNGRKDCLDGSDEKNCSPKVCSSKQFSCAKKNACIPLRWKCDGSPDCDDKSDESPDICRHTEETCKSSEGQFLCADKLGCFNYSKVCNTNRDCLDGSDEGEICKEHQCKDADCHHLCMPRPNGHPACFCQPGFELNARNNSCEDINECQNYGVCSQICSNVPGSYKCSCQEGYKQFRNTCKATKNSAMLFFSLESEIRSLELLPNGRKLFNTVVDAKHEVDSSHPIDLHKAIGVAFDALVGRIYWSEIASGKEAILSSSLNGQDRTVFHTLNINVTESMAFDYLGRNLYFVDSVHKYVGVKNVDNGYFKSLNFFTLDKPRDLTLYPEKGYLFLSDWSDTQPRIYRADMDGANIRHLVSERIKWPSGVLVDKPANRVYWSDSNYLSIESVDLEGRNRHKLEAESIKHPFSIAMFEDTIYWTDWEEKSLSSCHKFTGKNEEILFQLSPFVSLKPMGLTLYHPLMEYKKRTESPCFNNRCSHLCLLKPDGDYSCHCPPNMVLKEDQRTCQLEPSPPVDVQWLNETFNNVLSSKIAVQDKDELSYKAKSSDKSKSLNRIESSDRIKSLDKKDKSSDKPNPGNQTHKSASKHKSESTLSDRQFDIEANPNMTSAFVTMTPRKEIVNSTSDLEHQSSTNTNGRIQVEEPLTAFTNNTFKKKLEKPEHAHNKVVGIVVAVFILVAAILVAIFVYARYKRSRNTSSMSFRFQNINKRQRLESCGEELKDYF